MRKFSNKVDFCAKNLLENFMIKKDELFHYDQYLRKQNLSENTVTSYLWTIEYFN